MRPWETPRFRYALDVPCCGSAERSAACPWRSDSTIITLGRARLGLRFCATTTGQSCSFASTASGAQFVWELPAGSSTKGKTLSRRRCASCGGDGLQRRTVS